MHIVFRYNGFFKFENLHLFIEIFYDRINEIYLTE